MTVKEGIPAMDASGCKCTQVYVDGEIVLCLNYRNFLGCCISNMRFLIITVKNQGLSAILRDMIVACKKTPIQNDGILTVVSESGL